MNYEVLTIPPFDKQLKRLSKKYPSIKEDVEKLGLQLSENPTFGTPLGLDCYKIRLAIASKDKGKSGGARVITHIYVKMTSVFLIAIYDKSDQDDMTDNEIKTLIASI